MPPKGRKRVHRDAFHTTNDKADPPGKKEIPTAPKTCVSLTKETSIDVSAKDDTLTSRTLHSLPHPLLLHILSYLNVFDVFELIDALGSDETIRLDPFHYLSIIANSYAYCPFQSDIRHFITEFWPTGITAHWIHQAFRLSILINNGTLYGAANAAYIAHRKAIKADPLYEPAVCEDHLVGLIEHCCTDFILTPTDNPCHQQVQCLSDDGLIRFAQFLRVVPQQFSINVDWYDPEILVFEMMETYQRHKQWFCGLMSIRSRGPAVKNQLWHVFLHKNPYLGADWLNELVEWQREDPNDEESAMVKVAFKPWTDLLEDVKRVGPTAPNIDQFWIWLSEQSSDEDVADAATDWLSALRTAASRQQSPVKC